jgi:hypothetical protein
VLPALGGVELSLMSDAGENVTAIDNGGRRLSEAIRDVRNDAADRDDVVVDMREAQRMRLELLAAELAPVIADVPADIDWFDFVISSGLQPRFWIDAVSHVSMGRDRRTYRFLRDTRVGRVVLAESTDIKPVADQVTRYIAERIIERQRMMESGVAPAYDSEKRTVAPEITMRARGRHPRWKAFASGFGLVLAGGAVALPVVIAAAWLWEKLAAIKISF